jgi:thiamine biosynthesis protein ThiS
MRVIVNGEEVAVSVATLAALLVVRGFEGEWLATAVNGRVAANTARGEYRLEDGDRIEVLSPMQGG